MNDTRSSAASIKLLDVKKFYFIEALKVEALRGVSLELPTGTIASVTGRSGAGKSTLLHIIGTLDKPTEGAVILGGTDVSSMPDQMASNFRNSSIGFVFQTSNLLPEFTAIENVMLPGMIAGASKAAARDRASRLMHAVGLGPRENHRPGELSGGEQQRTSIARALFMAPPIMLADEPTGNLDKTTSRVIQDLLLGLAHEHKITLLLVTHDLELAARFPTRIKMEDGRVIEIEKNGNTVGVEGLQ